MKTDKKFGELEIIGSKRIPTNFKKTMHHGFFLFSVLSYYKFIFINDNIFSFSVVAQYSVIAGRI